MHKSYLSVVCFTLVVLLSLGMLWADPAIVTRPPARGPLRVSPINPRYFTDNTGKAIYLAGSHDGWELQDYAWGNGPERDPLWDWPGFLNFVVDNNLNAIRLWSVEHSKLIDADQDLTTPMCYQRVPGKGKANDGEDKCDLDKFNEALLQKPSCGVLQLHSLARRCFI